MTDQPTPTETIKGYWIATGRRGYEPGAKRVLGPFATGDLAVHVRSLIERLEHRTDLWIVDGERVPDA